ncbi:MAG: phosphomannomutase/phosphoglucomutase [Candidatus Heimdallarchaeota archaeon]
MSHYDHLFRTYDIRGEFPHDFSLETVLNLGRAFGEAFGAISTVVMGGDVRISTPVIKSALAAGLMEAQCNVIDVGLCTTPTIYFLAAHNAAVDGGIMITASHNPILYNGIKVCDGNGVAFHIDNFFRHIQRRVEQLEKKHVSSHEIREYGQLLQPIAVTTAQYWDYQREHFYPAREVRVGVELGNGTCFPIIDLLSSAGIHVKALNPQPDGHFPIMIPDPAKSECMIYLQELVRENNLDIGLGFDTDGDRIGVVDDQGKIIPSDQVIMLIGEYLLHKNPNAIIMIDVKTSRATLEYLTKLGAEVQFSKVGHSWIHEKLLRSGAIFAGELSGHFYFGGDYYGFDDAVYSALRVLEILTHSEEPLSSLLKNLPFYSASEEIRIPCSDHLKSKIVENIQNIVSEEANEIITIDGIRAEFDDGWILVRKSGTEPVISCRAEASTSQRLRYYQRYMQELITGEIEKIRET